MNKNRSCPLAAELAGDIRVQRDALASRWLARMTQPDDAGLDGSFDEAVVLGRITALLDAMADVIDGAANPAVDHVLRDRALQLADVRFSQGGDVGDFLHDCTLLADELLDRAGELAARAESARGAEEMHECMRRLIAMMFAVERAGAGRYARAQAARIGESEERLRRLGRTITHELKNRVGATLGAGQLLQEEWLGDAERIRFAGMVEENARAIQEAVEDLAALSGREGDRRRKRTVPLEEAVIGVLRQHRELARSRDVRLRVGAPLPDVEVNGSAFDVSLSAYLSNAVKFSDPAARERWAEVSAALEGSPDAAELVVRVRDNGIGVSAEVREHLFERFRRGREDGDGAGLGLSQVQKTVAALGGRAWAELDQEHGSVFAFSLPTSPDRRSAGVSGNGASARDVRPRRDPARAKASDLRP